MRRSGPERARRALVFFLLFSAGGARAEPETSLVEKAEERRRLAETRLAEARDARADARAELTRDLQAAQAKLQAARSTLDRVEAEAEAEARRAERAERTVAETERSRRELRRLLGQAGDLAPAGRDLPAPELREEILSRVEARLERLDHDAHVHESHQQILGRDGRPREARVLRLGRVLALADGDDPAATGFLSEAPGRPPQVVGPTLDPASRARLHEAVPGRAGRLPLDVDGALTRVQAEPPGPAAGFLASGGAFVWPILAVGLLGLLLLLERLVYFARPVRPGRIESVRAALESRGPEAAEALVTPARTALDRVLRAGVRVHGRSRAEREQTLETALLEEEPRLERNLALLGAVAGLAPLLGLLGTVTGMIGTFDVISTFGTGNPRLLSGGISVALVTTQLGLIVAVPALLAHAWVSRAVGKRQALLEKARTTLLELDDGGPS